MRLKLLFLQRKFIFHFFQDDLEIILKSRLNKFLFLNFFNPNLDKDRFLLFSPFKKIDREEGNLWDLLAFSNNINDFKMFESNIEILNKYFPLNKECFKKIVTFVSISNPTKLNTFLNIPSISQRVKLFIKNDDFFLENTIIKTHLLKKSIEEF